MRMNDLTGQKFGRWIVLRRGPNNTLKHPAWECQCDCGTTKYVIGSVLVSGRSKSCGCYRIERGREHGATINLRHGEASQDGRGHKMTPTYAAWSQMKSRCNNPKHSNYKRYGGRGIRVCERWSESYETFLEDVGERPSPKHTLDRKDNDGNYEPGNVRWATAMEQNRNTSSNRTIDINGVVKPLSEWLEHFGRARKTFYQRITRGMTEQEALETPLQKKNGQPLGRAALFDSSRRED